jgi:hypothetical protein
LRHLGAGFRDETKQTLKPQELAGTQALPMLCRHRVHTLGPLPRPERYQESCSWHHIITRLPACPTDSVSGAKSRYAADDMLRAGGADVPAKITRDITLPRCSFATPVDRDHRRCAYPGSCAPRSRIDAYASALSETQRDTLVGAPPACNFHDSEKSCPAEIRETDACTRHAQRARCAVRKSQERAARRVNARCCACYVSRAVHRQERCYADRFGYRCIL